MVGMPENLNKSKFEVSKLYLFALLAVTAALTAWILFFLVCPAADKLILLGCIVLAAFLGFLYSKNSVSAAVQAKRTQMDATLAEIKECQKGLLIEEKIATIAKFASVMAHELKNPLSSLKNISYYLIKTVKQEDPKGKRMMEMLSSEVDRANIMISDFSDIARARRVSKTFTLVSELVEQVLSDYKFEPEIEFSKDVEAGIETSVDPERTGQVLKNLLRNAKEAIGQGQKGSIKVTLKKNGEAFVITVSDSGPGIEPETIDHIYEPLFTTKNKAIGLGLTVVKQTVEAHGGKVEVETEKGKGSTFRVTMPIQPPLEQA